MPGEADHPLAHRVGRCEEAADLVAFVIGHNRVKLASLAEQRLNLLIRRSFDRARPVSEALLAIALFDDTEGRGYLRPGHSSARAERRTLPRSSTGLDSI